MAHFFPYAVCHNFNSAIRRALTLKHAIGEDEMRSQVDYYHTDAARRTCGCGQLKHFSALFNQLVPCCHLLAAEVPRPKMESLPVLLGADTDKVRIHSHTTCKWQCEKLNHLILDEGRPLRTLRLITSKENTNGEET
jgi:hypothetical protein